MKHNKYFSILAFLATFLVALDATAQSGTEQWNRVLERYKNLHAFQSEMNVRVYESAVANKPHLQFAASVHKEGARFLYQVAGQTTLFTPDCQVMVNEAMKQVVYAPRKLKRKQRKEQSTWFLSTANEPIELSDSIVLVQADDAFLTLAMYPTEGPIQKCLTLVNAETHLVEQITFFYKTTEAQVGAMVIIDYLKPTDRPKFVPDTFNPERFVRTSRKTVKLSPAFEKYALLVQHKTQ